MKKTYEESSKIIFTHEHGCERYTYSLLTFSGDAGDRYGVGIRLYTEKREHEQRTGALFSSRDGALRFLAYLRAVLATPQNLDDLIEDILTDFDQNR